MEASQKRNWIKSFFNFNQIIHKRKTTFKIQNLKTNNILTQQPLSQIIEIIPGCSLYLNLNTGKRIINIDESVLRSTDHRKRGWANVGNHNLVSHSQILQSMNIIAAISSQGEYFYTMNIGKTNSLTFLYFLQKLITHLDEQENQWRDNTVFLIDNAPYHRSKQTTSYLKELKVPVMYLGLYQYKLAPIELFFSYLKNRDLNSLQIRANSRKYMNIFMKELCLQITQLDFNWISKSFKFILTFALEALSMKNL